MLTLLLQVQSGGSFDINYRVTGPNGKYVLDGLHAGDWQVSIVGGSAKPVTLAPGSCVVLDLP